MKNTSKKFSIPLMGLSLVLAGGIIWSHSYAWTLNPGSSCSHSRKHWGEVRREDGEHIIYKYCNNCGDCLDTYYYDNPEITDFSLNPPEDVTSPDGKTFFEEGVTISNYSFTPDTGESSRRPGNEDSLITQKIEIIESNSNTTKLSVDLLSSGVSSFSLSTLPIGQYLARATVEDRYNEGTNSASEEETFYIGPYPTIYYTAHLTDDNSSNHKDTITIKNIKLLSTYLPKKTDGLTFYICDSNNPYTNPVDTISATRDDVYTEYKPDGSTTLGYISTFKINPSTQNLGENVKPLQNPYIMVKINDGRSEDSRGRAVTPDSTDPSAPKWAKYDNTYIPFL